jgi:hypothetical protein
MLFSGVGSMVILTSRKSLEAEAFLARLGRKEVKRFIPFEVPVDVAREKYGVHFDIVSRDLRETDDLRVLDFDGQRAIELLPFDVPGEPVFHEAK